LGHGLLEVFFGNKEHPKVFTLFFSQVFVVYFMRPSNTSGVGVVYVSEPFKALVNKDVVHHKIGDSVGENAESDRKANPEGLVGRHQKTHAQYGEKQEESVVALKPRFVVFLVVIFVQYPKKPVHNVLVNEPGHKFHDQKGEQKNSDPE
jgi:hypothetical protein